MATCPKCGQSSRDNPELMTLEHVGLSPLPSETYSLAGVQAKVACDESYRLECQCGWSVVGRIQGGHLVPL